MPNTVDIASIPGWQWPQMQSHWRQLLDGDIENDAAVFELMMVRGFELSSFPVLYPYRVQSDTVRYDLEQIDGAFFTEWGFSCLVESKKFRSRINADPIGKLFTKLYRRPSSTFGCFFSFSGYTESAIELAKFHGQHHIFLWEPDDINWAIEREDFRRAMWLKYQHAVQENLQPNFLVSIG
ncbi:MAG: hypothetical protein ACFB21_02575 [Opitutales bacterium]